MSVEPIVPQANKNVALVGHSRYLDMKRDTVLKVHQPFHTDNCHILALYSMHSACKGGRSRLASVRTVYDTLVANYPGAVELLKENWEWDSYVRS